MEELKTQKKQKQQRGHSKQWLEKKVVEYRERIQQLEEKQRQLRKLLKAKIKD